MTQLIGTAKLPFAHKQFPITPNTMGVFSEFPPEMLIEIFKLLDNKELANSTSVNWTFKEVIERNTEWGERKRFFRILPSLFNCSTVEKKPRSAFFTDFNLIESTLSNMANPTQVLSRILLHYPNARICGTGRRLVGNVIVMTYTIETANRQRLDIIVLYEIDMQKGTPHAKPIEHYYLLNPEAKKLQKLTLGNPPTVVNEYSFSPFTKRLSIDAIMGNRLLAWVTGYDLEDNDNPEKNFVILQAINKDTLQSEMTYQFYPFPDTPLPNLVTHIFLDHKFCIVIANLTCAIKMGKSTIRIDQKTLKPLLGMKIDHFSIQNRHDGQMEITLKGIKDNNDVCMKYVADPFYPVDNNPDPTPVVSFPF